MATPILINDVRTVAAEHAALSEMLASARPSHLVEAYLSQKFPKWNSPDTDWTAILNPPLPPEKSRLAKLGEAAGNFFARTDPYVGVAGWTTAGALVGAMIAGPMGIPFGAAGGGVLGYQQAQQEIASQRDKTQNTARRFQERRDNAIDALVQIIFPAKDEAGLHGTSQRELLHLLQPSNSNDASERFYGAARALILPGISQLAVPDLKRMKTQIEKNELRDATERHLHGVARGTALDGPRTHADTPLTS